jgi:hypothetical protein
MSNKRKGNVSLSQLYIYIIINFIWLHVSTGARGGAVVEALRYKPEGRGFDS